ncbi:Sialin, partial [Stegodyphus mimosarum]
MALGAVYYGQLVSFIPGGRMAELYGGKKMLILCTLISSLATIMSPISAVWSPYVFIVVRILVGIGTGPIIPIVFFMLARWIPQTERSFHASFILSGYGVGSFLAVIVSGALCGTTFLNGWPSVFYTGGFFGILWCFVCAYMMSETPTRHANISIEEISYILNGLETAKREKILKIPWKEMALSVPLWALAIGFFGQFWLLGFFSTVHALYMGTVLQLPVAKNGVLSCLPHLLRAFATCIASYPVDILLKRELVSVGFVRKGATIINTVVSCGAFLGITLVGRNVTATTLLFILGGVLGEFVTFGVCMACIDIAPSLSGTVSGIINIVGVFPFFMIPALVGYMTNYENSIEQWKKVFYVTISIVSVSTLLFVIFGDLKPQSWGIAPQSENKRKKKEDVAESDHLTEPKHFLHSI